MYYSFNTLKNTIMKILIKIFWLIILFICDIVSMNSQSIFLVMANNDIRITEMALTKNDWKDFFYYKKLYKLEKGQLKLIDTLNAFDDQLVDKLVQFPDQKLIYIAERDFALDTLLNYSFSFLDYSTDKLILRRYYTGWDTLWRDNYSYAGFAIDRNGKLIVNDRIDFDSKNNGLKQYGIDKFFNKYIIKNSDFKNLVNFGYSGFKWGFSFFVRYSEDDFSEYKAGWYFKELTLPNAPQIPDSIKDFDIKSYAVVFSNKKYWLLHGPTEFKYTPDTTTKVFIYDKDKNLWDTIRVPGVNGACSIEDDWLFGIEKRRDTCDFIRSSDYCFNQYWSERKMLEKKYNMHNGRPDSFRKFPGILYIYHIPTKNLITWQARDRDSEIIQIIDGYIYYRVFDELRKVKLDEKILNIAWSTDELIVKNRDVIPYVHHIFFSNTTQTKCEEVWVNKPKK